MSSRILLGGTGLLFLILVASGIVIWQATAGESQSTPETINFDAEQIAPDTIALVNGEPVSVRLVDIMVAGGTAQEDAFDYAVDQQLLIQAGERLGLTATTAEAIQWLKDVEASWQDAPQETKEEIEAGLIAAGMPTSDLWRDPVVIGKLGVPAATIVKVRRHIADQAGVDVLEASAAIEEFLEQERARATVIDCRTQDCAAVASD